MFYFYFINSSLGLLFPFFLLSAITDISFMSTISSYERAIKMIEGLEGTDLWGKGEELNMECLSK